MEFALTLAETSSLILILLAFALFLRLAARSKSVRTLQFDLFLFALVLVVTEVPHVLINLGLINMELYATPGLAIHTFAMGLVSVAITHRFYRMLRASRAMASHG